MLSTPWLPVPVCKALVCARWSEGGDADADTATSRLHSSPCSPKVVASRHLPLQSAPSLLARSACPLPIGWKKREGGNPFRLLAKLLFVWQRLFSSLSISLSLFSQSCKCSLLPFLLTAFELLLLVAWCRSFPSAAPHLTLRQGCYLYHKHPTSWKWAPLQAGDSQ